MKEYNLLTSEYIMIAIIISIITLSVIIKLPITNPKAFFYLSICVLVWYLANIANILYKTSYNVYSVKLRHIIGFICTMFLVYGFTYYALFNLDDKSFTGNLRIDRDQPLSFATYYDMIYFTMSVFSTAGFGDITPLSRVARSIVMTQFIAGFVLVGVLLSRVG
jgi:hypothetical protein